MKKSGSLNTDIVNEINSGDRMGLNILTEKGGGKMFNKILLIAVAGLFVLGVNRLSFAMMCDEHGGSQHLAQAHSEHDHGAAEPAQQQEYPKKAVNAGNKICPVSGEKIDEETKATYEYEGKIYNFCCASCIGEFKKDPQKYIKKVEDELQQSQPREESKHENTKRE